MEKVIYRNNSILHGCDTIEAIFEAANEIATKRNKFEAVIYQVGQYADKMQSSWIRYNWHRLRNLYLSGDIWGFRCTFRNFCDGIYNSLGRFAWYNTLTL